MGLAVLKQIQALVTPVDRALYEDLEQFARRRVATRDLGDWPVVAVAFLLDVPIWTEDQDFSAAASRCGPPICVELYFQDGTLPPQKQNST